LWLLGVGIFMTGHKVQSYGISIRPEHQLRGRHLAMIQYFSAFQIQGFNRSNDPVTATKAYLQSNITGTEVQLLFGGDIPIEKGVIEPQANFALISVPGPWRNPPEKPDARAIRKEFGSFTFVFQSPQKNYSIRFERNDVDRIIENAGRELMRTPKPTVIPRH
jgi:hypothetical protein